MKKIIYTAAVLTLNFELQTSYCSAQCTDGKLYYMLQTSNIVMSYDPSLPLSGSNPISTGIIAPQSGGLAYGSNLNAASPSPTFYTVSTLNEYNYWNGSAWVSTGHVAGAFGAVNIGAGGGYIYNYDGSTGNVYSYNGTGDATLVTTVTTPIFDIAVDDGGNFAVLTNTELNFYSPAGSLLISYTVTGLPSGGLQTGLAIIGSKVYTTYGTSSPYAPYVGTISGSTVTFVADVTYWTSPLPTDYASCGTSSILPITLLTFTASCHSERSEESKIVLHWQTATETNNDYFTIERAAPSNSPKGGGLNWEVAGTVKGAGNSSTTRNYEFVDQLRTPDSQLPTLYYRLKQTDFDGKTETFNNNLVAVDVTECAVKVFPNPAGNTLYVPYTAEQDGEVILQVYDVIGKLVKEKTVAATKGNNKFTLDLSTVAQGIYILRVNNGTVKRNEKFVKQ